jgi:hypothetical protein
MLKTCHFTNFFISLDKKLNGISFSSSSEELNTPKNDNILVFYGIINFPVCCIIYKFKGLIIFPEILGKILEYV